MVEIEAVNISCPASSEMGSRFARYLAELADGKGPEAERAAAITEQLGDGEEYAQWCRAETELHQHLTAAQLAELAAQFEHCEKTCAGAQF